MANCMEILLAFGFQALISLILSAWSEFLYVRLNEALVCNSCFLNSLCVGLMRIDICLELSGNTCFVATR